jgi:hypothetical protein
MSKEDKLDAVSDQMHGHTNWTYLSSIGSRADREEILDEKHCVVVVFWKNPDYDADT